MQEAIKREIQKSSQQDTHSDLRFLSALELSLTTGNENLVNLSNVRKNLITPSDDLTNEERTDIQEFRIESHRKRFSNVDDFIADLND